MTDLWFGLALLLLPLALITAWPLIAAGSRRRRATQTEAVLAALYHEHVAELDASLASGAIDAEQHRTLSVELGRNLLSADGKAFQAQSERGGGRGLLLGLLLLLPVATVVLYWQWGSHRELSLHRELLASQQGAGNPQREAWITEQLRARVAGNPMDLTSRYVLAQRQLVSGDLAGAVDSYRLVVAHEPEAVGIKAELAQALFFAGGSRITDEVRGLVGEVLELEPGNGTALGLAGIAAFDSADYGAARDFWQRALDQLPPQSAAAQALAAGVMRAEAALAEGVSAGSEEIAGDAPAGPAIRVRVALADAVAAAPDTPVFVYARGEASPMPLAIVKLSASDLPAEVVLDESRAMMPGMSLASVEQVQLVARLALAGDARPAPGDWQGVVESLPETEWSKPVSITIDREL